MVTNSHLPTLDNGFLKRGHLAICSRRDHLQQNVVNPLKGQHYYLLLLNDDEGVLYDEG